LTLLYTDPTKPVKFEAGGQGLTSTVMDYARFVHMLLNRGSLDGARILGKKTVELMTTDQVGPGIDHGPFFLPGQSHGYGLLGAVRIDGPRARAAEPDGRLDRRVLPGRLRRDVILGGPEGRTGRRVHDAVGQAVAAVCDVVQDPGGAVDRRVSSNWRCARGPVTSDR